MLAIAGVRDGHRNRFDCETNKPNRLSRKCTQLGISQTDEVLLLPCNLYPPNKPSPSTLGSPATARRGAARMPCFEGLHRICGMWIVDACMQWYARDGLAP